MKYLILHFAKSKVYYLLTLIIITFSSCSSYQNTTADNDGIYNTSTKTQEVEEVAVVTNESKIKTRKYEKYFKKNAEKYDITEEEVFTDIDTYKSEDEIEAEEEELDRDVDDFSYPNNSWEDSEETVVNVYNYGGYRSPYYYGGFYRPYYSYYNPFSFHFGWYGGFYNSWAYGCSPYYGYGNYGYYRPYYYGSNYGGYYGGHNDYAYGRRSARNTSFASKYDRNRSRTNTATRRSTSRDSNARTATRTRNNTNARNARRTNLNRTARPSQRTNRRVAPQRRVSPQKRNTSTRVRTNRSSSSRSVTPTRRSSSSRSKSVSSSRRSTSSRSSSTRSSSSRSSRRH